jgi:hypothetical protein
MFRAVVAAGVVAALVMAVKEGVVVRDLGLVGSCRQIATPPGMTGEWLACRPGRLDGRPDLTRRLCFSQGRVRTVEYWTCPYPGDRGIAVSSG